MSGFILVNQSPPSFDWCSNFLQSSSISPFQLRNAANTAPVYVSTTGVSPSVFFNQKGTWTYTYVKTGATTGTATGTAVAPAITFTDAKVGGVGTTTNYSLTMVDANTGISATQKNSVVWGVI